MPRTFHPFQKKLHSPSFSKLCQPLEDILPKAPLLKARGDRPLKMTFEDQLNMLIFYHLNDFTSGRHLLQSLKEDDFARDNIAPVGGIGKSAFFEAINYRGLEQLEFIFQQLCNSASKIIPEQHADLGDLVLIDGSLIDATLSMLWADYRSGSKKAKAHLGFDLNHGIPNKIFLTNGNGGERPFVDQILLPGQTGVCDRGYQSHKLFDELQKHGKHFVIRIKASTQKTVVKEYDVKEGGSVFFDAEVHLGTVANKNQTQQLVRLVGYRIGTVDYWVATDRRDLTADQVAKAYELRWRIEIFFGWWKRHLRVYHLIARSQYGLMVQILAGLITYCLLAIYCRQNHNEPISIKRLRQLRNC